MFQLHFARGLRTGISQTFSIQLAALRIVRPATYASRRLPLKTQEQLYHTVERSFLNNASNEVQLTSIQRMVRSFCTSSTCHSEEGKLIYSGNLGNAVRGVKMFSYTSSGASLCVMPYILLKTGISVHGLVLKGAFCGVIGFFTFLTPILLHIITKGYVVRLYHNQDTDTYTAVTYNVLLMEKKTVFRQSEVKIPGVSKMFTTFYADKKSMLVNPMLFPLPHDYNHLMGYDQPFSFDTEDLDVFQLSHIGFKVCVRYNNWKYLEFSKTDYFCRDLKICNILKGESLHGTIPFYLRAYDGFPKVNYEVFFELWNLDDTQTVKNFCVQQSF